MPARLNHTIVWCRDKKRSERVRQRTTEIWADPAKMQPGRINRHFGGRSVYFDDPDGHLFEIITKPYGDPADL